jgi:hypothetical protein
VSEDLFVLFHLSLELCFLGCVWDAFPDDQHISLLADELTVASPDRIYYLISH